MPRIGTLEVNDFARDRAAADHLDAAAGIGVERLLQQLAAAAVVAEHGDLVGRLVAGDQVAQDRERLAAAGEVDGRRDVALQDALADRIHGLVVGHHRADRGQLDLQLAAGHLGELGQPVLLDVRVEGLAGGHRGLDLPDLLGASLRSRTSASTARRGHGPQRGRLVIGIVRLPFGSRRPAAACLQPAAPSRSRARARSGKSGCACCAGSRRSSPDGRPAAAAGAPAPRSRAARWSPRRTEAGYQTRRSPARQAAARRRRRGTGAAAGGAAGPNCSSPSRAPCGRGGR